MDAETLSRVQFALTASFHFIFPPLSMGLGLMLVVLGVIYVRTKDPKWRRLSFFWVKVYGLIFALGVATGIVQEFEFGMNWADYSRFVGNVFGSLLAAEGVFAFFLEGGFLGLMLFGGNRLGPRLWLFSIFMVVFGAHFSALWILMANSWMQTPQGYEIVNNRGRDDRLLAGRLHAVVHPAPAARLGGLVDGRGGADAERQRLVPAQEAPRRAGQVEHAGGAARLHPVRDDQRLRLRGQHGDRGDRTTSRSSWRRWRASTRANRAPGCSSSAGSTTTTQTTTGISIPCLLSFLAYQDIHATVQGIDSFAPDPTPPINLVFQVYHFMITMGPALAGDRAAGRADVPVEAAAVRVPLRAVAAGAHRLRR